MNIAEILKYCPKGAKLYSTTFGEVTFDGIDSDETYPIKVSSEYSGIRFFTKEGKYDSHNGECVLFPSKDQRDWNKFRIPVMRGDIMMDINNGCAFIANGKVEEHNYPIIICGIDGDGNLTVNNEEYDFLCTSDLYIPASEEAKKELFDKMKEAGYKWNADTLELEKLESKFKKGDVLIDRQNTLFLVTGDIIDDKKQHTLIKQEFKPFDKVLVRNATNEKWSINLFSYYNKENKIFPYVCIDGNYHHCMPYEGNEYIVGTTTNPYQ